MLQHDLPRRALSIRQPWAWAIIHAGKNIENRSWRSGSPDLQFRGEFAIHAAKGMTQDEYRDAVDTIFALTGLQVPPPARLHRGGIVGTGLVSDITMDHPSAWFSGRHGLVLEDVKAVDFIPSVGHLGFFAWEPSQSLSEKSVPAWMRRWSAEAAIVAEQPSLF